MASGPCRRLVVGARGMSSVLTRRPLPLGHHGRPRAAPRRNFLQAGWNHGKNHVPRVAIAWKAVQRNSAATRERLHQVWGGLDAPMMNDRLVLSALSFWPPAGTAENGLSKRSRVNCGGYLAFGFWPEPSVEVAPSGSYFSGHERRIQSARDRGTEGPCGYSYCS